MADEKLGTLKQLPKKGNWATNWFNQEFGKKRRWVGTPRVKESERLAALAKKREQENERNARARERVAESRERKASEAIAALKQAPALKTHPLEYVRYWKTRLDTCSASEKRIAFLRLQEAEIALMKRLGELG